MDVQVTKGGTHSTQRLFVPLAASLNSCPEVLPKVMLYMYTVTVQHSFQAVDMIYNMV